MDPTDSGSATCGSADQRVAELLDQESDVPEVAVAPELAVGVELARGDAS